MSKQGPQYTVAYNSSEGEWYMMDQIRAKVEAGEWTRDQVAHEMTWLCPVERCRQGVMTPRMGSVVAWHFARTDYGHVEGCDLEINPPDADFVRRKRNRDFDPTGTGRPTMDVSALLREPRQPNPTTGAAVTTMPAGEKPAVSPGGDRSSSQSVGYTSTIPHNVSELMQWIQYQRQLGVNWQTHPIACKGHDQLQTMGDLVFTGETLAEVTVSTPNGAVRYVYGEVWSARYEPSKGRYPAAVRVALKRWTERTANIYVYVHQKFHEVIKPGAIIAARVEKIKTTEDRGAVLFRAAKGKDLREDFVEVYRIETRDHHVVRSSHEQLIDDWLYQHRIDHDVPGPLSERCPVWKCARAFDHGDGYYIPDFILYLPRGPVVAEHYGFGGAWVPGQEYRENRARKDAFYQGLAQRTKIRYEALEPPGDQQTWDEMLMERLGKYIGERKEPEFQPVPVTAPLQPEPKPVATTQVVVNNEPQSAADNSSANMPAVTTVHTRAIGTVAAAIISGLRRLFGRRR